MFSEHHEKIIPHNRFGDGIILMHEGGSSQSKRRGTLDLHEFLHDNR